MRVFGKMLRETFREDDVACRTGGEEFAVILPGADAVDAARRINELGARVNQQQIPFGSETSLSFTFSAGVATSPQNGETSHDLFHNADIALYEAKRQGRNRVVIAELLSVARALTHHGEVVP
jgi:diguanylate cyclase (GGDEF)-like protein